MSRVVLCNVCSAICQSNQYFSLQGWQGKGTFYPGNRREKDAWVIQQRQDIEGLAADVCPPCLRDRLNLVLLQPVKTRETLRQELLAQNPQASPLAVLRKVIEISATSVSCALCESSCIDKHLLVQSGWLTSQGEALTAELCDACVKSNLMSIVRFQQTPVKQTDPEPSAS
jgi:hypothetical protein